jgi:hypothetical protein
MIKNKLKLFLLFLSAVALLSFKAEEETPLEKLLKQLAKITEAYPQEKVHLHLDKPYYAVGEDIWFKAYLITAEKGEPSFLSAVLYIDLIDSKNQVKKNIRIAVKDGMADGNISLIDSISSGDYRIRAYTNYMRNYNADFFFEKSITIGSISGKTTTQKAVPKTEFDIKFFPEGGSLVNGIRSKVGVKVVASTGLGANVSGYILNSAKEQVAVFECQHAGMGVFAIKPEKGEKYTAVITLPDGQSKSFSLPNASESGYALALALNKENLNVRVSSSPDLISSKELAIVAQGNGVVYNYFKLKPEQAIISTNIPLKNLPTGIVQVTLFNEENKPIAERLVFVNHQDQLKIDVKNMNESDGIKKKSQFGLTVNDIAGHKIDGSFSVAVTDGLLVNSIEDDETTILSNFLLTSDLKGYIEKPNYYFNNVTSDKEMQLDQLMLTQGWRRFTWDDVIANKEPQITHRPELTLEITGKVTTLGNKPIPGATVSLLSASKGFELRLDTIADAKGNFVFDRLDLPDSVSVLLHAKMGKKTDDIKIVLDQYPPVRNQATIVEDQNLTGYLANTKTMYKELEKVNMLDKGIQLEEVSIVAKKELKPLLNTPNSKNASGAADYVMRHDRLQYETDILMAFSKIPGITVQDKQIKRSSSRTNSITSQKLPPVMLIIDGVRSDMDALLSISPNQLEGIEVLVSNYNTAIYGPDGYWGVVHVTTMRGSSAPINPSTNNARIKNAGFTTMKEFYSPNYDDPKIKQQIYDLRSTIYWNPNVKTDINGNANISFFNAGTPGNYRITIEGMDAFGNLGRKTYTYVVK